MTIEKKTDQVDPNPGIHAGEFDLSRRPQSYLLESVEDAISILVSGEYRRFRIRLGVESKDVEALRMLSLIRRQRGEIARAEQLERRLAKGQGEGLLPGAAARGERRPAPRLAR